MSKSGAPEPPAPAGIYLELPSLMIPALAVRRQPRGALTYGNALGLLG